MTDDMFRRMEYFLTLFHAGNILNHELERRIHRRIRAMVERPDQTGDNRFFIRMIPIADRLYDDYIPELRTEGLITRLLIVRLAN
jgi:hypothetical protein